jgi:hypothetical protein
MKRVLGVGIKLLASAGALCGALTFSQKSYAVEGLFRIAPQNAPHKSFDLPGGGCPYNAGNTPSSLALYRYDNVCSTGDQQWYIHDTGGNQHTIRQGGANGKCLDIDNGGTGSRLGTYDCYGGAGQLWVFDEMMSMGTDGLYGLWRIKSVRDGRVLDLAGGTTDDGNVIQVYSDNGSSAQRWILWGNGGMHQDWADDFSGSSLDTGSWTAASIGAGRYNNEKQSYDPGQVRIQSSSTGSHMTIVASDPGNCTGSGCYVSGRVNSKGKRWFRNGMFSSRVHYYENAWGNMGAWPAFWLLGNWNNEDPYNASTVSGNCWPTSGARELDIWEWVRNSGGVYSSTAIYNNSCGASWPTNYQTTGGIAWNSGDWVITSVKIDGGRVKYYLGGRKVADYPDTGFVNEDFAFIFNMAIGGDLGGDTSGFYSNSEWASIDVDWVAHETW